MIAPDGKKTVTDEKGAFTVTFDKKATGPIKVDSDKTAPLQKPAPKEVEAKVSLHADLKVKTFDAVTTFDAHQGGRVEHEGTKLELSGDQLEASAGELGPKARLVLAAITPDAPGDATAITGNYDAKKGEVIGKVSTATASLGTLANPVVGVIGSVILLGERPTSADWIGFALIFGAAACVLLQPRPQAASPPRRT